MNGLFKAPFCDSLTCPLGEYADTNDICEDCVDGCEDCNDDTSCNTCFDDKLDPATNCTDCIDVYYEDDSGNC